MSLGITFGRPVTPCGDCIDGHCTMNCSTPMVAGRCGDEPLDPPTEEERRAEAWEYWHQRAIALENALYALVKAASDRRDQDDVDSNMTLTTAIENAHALLGRRMA